MSTISTPIKLFFVFIAVGLSFVPTALCQEAPLSKQPTLQRKMSLSHDLPPVIKIVETSDLNSTEFPHDFALKLRNIGTKPIYHAMVFMDLPELDAGDTHWSYELEYGRHAFYYRAILEMAKPEDDPIKPGEIFTLTLKAKHIENSARLLKQLAELRGMPIEITKIELDFNLINFGDGTGYFGDEPLPQKPRR